MVVHERVDVTQETGCNDTYTSERETRQIDVFIALGVSELAGIYNHLVRCLVVSNARNHLEFFQEGSASKSNGFFNVRLIQDAQFECHGATDVVDGVGDEFADEDIVVDAIADATTDDTNSESQGCNGGNEILLDGVSRGPCHMPGKALTSGQIMVVMMDAGTTIPPIPSPARMRRPQSWYRLSTRAT